MSALSVRSSRMWPSISLSTREPAGVRSRAPTEDRGESSAGAAALSCARLGGDAEPWESWEPCRERGPRRLSVLQGRPWASSASASAACACSASGSASGPGPGPGPGSASASGPGPGSGSGARGLREPREALPSSARSALSEQICVNSLSSIVPGRAGPALSLWFSPVPSRWSLLVRQHRRRQPRVAAPPLRSRRCRRSPAPRTAPRSARSLC
jgi:hypothetical protein